MIILRPITASPTHTVTEPSSSPGAYHVIGYCYLHGFADGAALLGPVPSPWKVRYNYDSRGYKEPYFHNSTTAENCLEDPRMGPLPPQWERLDAVRTKDDPQFFAKFRNKITGQVMNSDPRLLPAALIERGVKVEDFYIT
jgi:hypothetical protein